MPPVGLKGREWPRFLSAPDPQLLQELYVPGLAASVRYDRCCAYFSSTSLQAAAMGFGKLIETLESMGPRAPKPAIRLLVNEELHPADVRALVERGDAKPLEAHLGKRFKNPAEALQRQRLAMLGWLVKRGLLEVRVGVMRTSGGVLHAKFGSMIDPRGHSLVFRGSGNESAAGMLTNYEQIEISPSWKDPDVARHYQQEFESLWAGTHPSVMTVPLPEAIQAKLIRLAPKKAPTDEPQCDLMRQRAAMVWRWIAEAPFMPFGGEVCDSTAMVRMWPHQRHVVAETAAAWPDGRMLCDEVGMGKTLEAILVLRRLLAGRGVKRALILVPAGLLGQWQAELREKGGIIVPRFQGEDLVWPDGREERRVGLGQALRQPVLLLSRETARLHANLLELLAAEPWDLVVLDEAHAARRKGDLRDFNSGNLLLSMLRELQVSKQAKGLMLLSATPMQTMPWEPWDLLQPLGEGGPWIAEFSDIGDFYDGIVRIQSGGELTAAQVGHCASMVACDPDFPSGSHPEWKDPQTLVDAVLFGDEETKKEIARWLRQGSPLTRRLHRNTRDTLKSYHELGLLERPPAQRKVIDRRWDFRDSREREVYRAVETYIHERWQAMETEKPGKGFVMTVYRRRAASSFYALHRSLERRLELVERYMRNQATGEPLDSELPENFDVSDLADGLDNELPSSAPSSMEEAKEERAQLQQFLADLEGLGGQDSKLEEFVDVLNAITNDDRPCLVFSEYVDTMTYLRDQLLPRYSSSRTMATYSGGGGEWYDGHQWVRLTKDEVTKKLRAGELRIVVCTDAASEGLNLQAASALVNYDLPWNPSKVEQRIGRIDRIGQEQSEIRIVNMFLKDSVDDRVYGQLRMRCCMFEHFVGRMQPVLSHAKKLLLGETSDFRELESAIQKAEADVLSQETYLSKEAMPLEEPPERLSHCAMVAALEMLREVQGASITMAKDRKSCKVSMPGFKGVRLGMSASALERDLGLVPLNPSNDIVRKLADALGKGQEGLPLVVATAERGPFRASCAFWVTGSQPVLVDSADQLIALVHEWDGTRIGPHERQRAQVRAQEEAESRVNSMESVSQAVFERLDERQRQGAKARLALALFRTLAAQTGSSLQSDVHRRMHYLIERKGPAGDTLSRAHRLLGGYPHIPEHHRPRVSAYVQNLKKSDQEAAATLQMVQAANADPRWRVQRQEGKHRNNVKA